MYCKDENLLSIYCITYNQKDYIKRCLDGFVMQKTNFKFEVIVYDDCSTDGTRDIIEEYSNKYPETIKTIFPEHNIAKSEGFYKINQLIYNQISGKYVAFCEGDDYWTDENKLQIQVDYLEKHPKLVGCFHKSVRKNIVNPEVKDIYFPQAVLKNVKEVYTNKDIQKNYFIETCSVMYRFDKYKEDIISTYPQKIINGDTYMLNYFSLHGNIGYIDRLMSVKTMNDLGVWNSQKQSLDERNIRYAEEIVNLPIVINNLYKRFNKGPVMSVRDSFYMVINSAIKLNRNDVIIKIVGQYWDNYINEDKEIISNLNKKKNRYKNLFNIISILFVLLLISFIIVVTKLVFLMN